MLYALFPSPPPHEMGVILLVQMGKLNLSVLYLDCYLVDILVHLLTMR